MDLPYNIFVITNISSAKSKPISTRRIAQLFRVLGQPTRLRILMTIGAGEACVCHLETALGTRQAVISQHLMALRRAGLVRTQREGRNIFYSLTHPEILELIQRSGATLGGSTPEDFPAEDWAPLHGCPCPHCARKDLQA